MQDHETGFSLHLEAVDHLGQAKHFETHHVAAHVTAAAVGCCVKQTLSLHAAWIISREFQSLGRHGKLRVAVFCR